MMAWICARCGVQHPDTERPPPGCPVCSDERQYVGWDGQRWTTMRELARDHARERVGDLGGMAAIAMSHAHFYGANVEIADTFDARVLVPNADRTWVQRNSPRIEYFDERVEPVPGVTVARIGGHFDGAAVLHWPATVEDIAGRVERFSFDRIYGGWWGRVVIHDGAATVRRSADRYLARLRGERPA
jgi:hypothetical protein